MPGLDPGIHRKKYFLSKSDPDRRVKPGNDDGTSATSAAEIDFTGACRSSARRPTCVVGASLVGALQELHQHVVGASAFRHRLVGQDELPEILVVGAAAAAPALRRSPGVAG